MEKFFRNKRELVLWLVGSLLALLVLFYIAVSVSFLTGKINAIFDKDLLVSDKVVKFNLEKAKGLRK